MPFKVVKSKINKQHIYYIKASENKWNIGIITDVLAEFHVGHLSKYYVVRAAMFESKDLLTQNNTKWTLGVVLALMVLKMESPDFVHLCPRSLK